MSFEAALDNGLRVAWAEDKTDDVLISIGILTIRRIVWTFHANTSLLSNRSLKRAFDMNLIADYICPLFGAILQSWKTIFHTPRLHEPSHDYATNNIMKQCHAVTFTAPPSTERSVRMIYVYKYNRFVYLN